VQTAITITNSAFSYDLPALSIVTFVGQTTNIVPTITSFSISGGQATLVVSGQAGPTYTLLGSTDLMHWQPLSITNPPTSPFTMVDTNFIINADAFYRVQASP
jgi:hypothetical protein